MFVVHGILLGVNGISTEIFPQGVAGADICLYQPLQRRLHSLNVEARRTGVPSP